MRRFDRPAVAGALFCLIGWTLWPQLSAAETASKEVVIRIACTVQPGDHEEQLCGKGAEKRWAENSKIRAWARKNGNVNVRIVVLPTPVNTNEQLRVYAKYLSSMDKKHSADILQIDMIWAGHLADLLRNIVDDCNQDNNIDADLRDHIGLESYCVKNSSDGRHYLKALPWFANVGLLYYRPSLLRHVQTDKNGPLKPPERWEQLRNMAEKLIKNEAINESGQNIAGFVFQGANYEGLLCNALEWMGADENSIIEPKAGENLVHLKSTAKVQALRRAANWIGRIAPPGVLFFNEQQSRDAFANGRAVFLRHWPTALRFLEERRIPGTQRKLDFEIARLPGFRDSSDYAGCLGGAGLAISKNSTADRELAKIIVRELSSAGEQKRRFEDGYYVPTRNTVFQDARFLKENKRKKDILKKLHGMLKNSKHIAVRPVHLVNDNYPEISRVITTSIHDALSGRMTSDKALEEAQGKVYYILNPLQKYHESEITK